MTFEEFDRLSRGSRLSFLDKETNELIEGTFYSYNMNRSIKYAKLDIKSKKDGVEKIHIGIDHSDVKLGWSVKEVIKLNFKKPVE